MGICFGIMIAIVVGTLFCTTDFTGQLNEGKAQSIVDHGIPSSTTNLPPVVLPHWHATNDIVSSTALADVQPANANGDMCTARNTSTAQATASPMPDEPANLSGRIIRPNQIVEIPCIVVEPDLNLVATDTFADMSTRGIDQATASECTAPASTSLSTTTPSGVSVHHIVGPIDHGKVSHSSDEKKPSHANSSDSTTQPGNSTTFVEVFQGVARVAFCLFLAAAVLIVVALAALALTNGSLRVIQRRRSCAYIADNPKPKQSTRWRGTRHRCWAKADFRRMLRCWRKGLAEECNEPSQVLCIVLAVAMTLQPVVARLSLMPPASNGRHQGAGSSSSGFSAGQVG